MDQAANKGYLLENFRLFHLKDRRAPKVESHYHEFDKLVILYSGAVDYTLEGAVYRMRPGDVLFVRHHEIHRPVISPERVYERVVLWISPEYLLRLRTGKEGESLENCFERSAALRSCLYRPGFDRFTRIKRLLSELEEALNQEEFGSELLADACFTQFMVEMNRMVLLAPGELPQSTDRQIGDALRFIHAHLAEPLSVDALAEACFLSRYYLMHRFREVTGCTVHNYIQQKRLTAAAERLNEGMGISEAAHSVGFSEYSSFLRAFRKNYGMTPSEYQRKFCGLEGDYRE